VAATLCIPFAQGVPYAPGPPDWWLTGDPYLDELRKLRNDPRWNGAARVGVPGSGAGSGELGSIRALRTVEGGQAYLYLGLSVYQDLEPEPLLDRVFIGFHKPGATAYLLSMASGSASGPFTPHAVVQVRHWRSTAPAALGALTWNATVEAAALPWVSATARAWARPGEWAIHLRVPLTAAAPAGGLPGGVEEGSVIAFLLQDRIPTTAQVVNYAFPGGDHLIGTPDSSQWAEIKPAGDPACLGIAMEPYHAGIWHLGTTNVPSSDITAGATNTFFAMPTNKTAAAIPALPAGTQPEDWLNAVFRIANWGSAINPTSTPVPGLTGPWAQIIPDPNVPTATPPTNTVPIPTGPPTVQMTGTWNAPPAPPATRNHQCVQVQLSGPFTFLSDSVVRNMDIVQASRFERTAEINVRGLGELAGPKRTVYLYLDITNMPERVPTPPERDPDGGRERLLARYRAEHGGNVRQGDGDGGFPPEDPPTLDDIAEGQPSYRVYGFYETGERWRFDGEDVGVLAPQTSFGYFVEHTGPLYGWQYELTGPGIKRIAENLYRLHVPNEGFETVRTRITAHEQRPPWWKRGCLPQILAAIGALGALAALLWRVLRR
jgi:hypothetical protein